LFKNEPYKLELINELPDEEVIIYKNGDFVDLCKGPHLSTTGEIKAFKLLSVAGAYWRGDEKNPCFNASMVRRLLHEKTLLSIYRCWKKQKKRDHRKLGRELELYITDDIVGAGLIIYQPKGGAVTDCYRRLGKGRASEQRL